MTQHKCGKKPPVQPLLQQFSILFFICKLLAITPHDFKEFQKYKRLQKSQGGQLYMICSTVMICINFNLMLIVFENTDLNGEQSK